MLVGQQSPGEIKLLGANDAPKAGARLTSRGHMATDPNSDPNGNELFGLVGIRQTPV